MTQTEKDVAAESQHNSGLAMGKEWGGGREKTDAGETRYCNRSEAGAENSGCRNRKRALGGAALTRSKG